MKPYLIILLFASTFSYAQYPNYNFSLNCYYGGDTIPKEAFKNIKFLEIVNTEKNRVGEKWILLSWDLILFYGEGSRANSTTKINGSPKLINTAMRPLIEGKTSNYPKKIVIDKIIAKSEDGKVVSFGSVNYYIGKTNKICPKSNKSIAYKGKLLMGKTEKEPIVNQKVILNEGKDKSNQTTFTDKYGDFTFENLSVESSYNIEIPNDDSKIKDGQIYLAKQDGSNIRSLKKVGANFVYELLYVELTKLSVEEVDDTELTLSSFSNSKNTELSVLKDILFEVNSINIPMESKPVIDKIISSMKNNKSLKLSIIGHTDSQGDDLKNKQLSVNRANNVMNYFVDNGIEKERLSIQGLGETKLLNRCKNGIDCSEEEHKLNRRTEFIFSK
jgi:outer membrane protein OmpA-like peptidoglycan-associated protein